MEVIWVAVTYLDNPAGRLHNVLAKLQAKAKRNEKINMHQAMREILNVEHGGYDVLLERMAPIFALPTQIRAEVAALGFEDNTHVEHFGKIEKILPQLWQNRPIKQFADTLDPVAMQELKTCSATLHRERPLNDLPSDEVLLELRKQVRLLIDDILESKDLPTELKTRLLDHLREMEQALDLYQIVGLDALRRTFERGMGILTVQTIADGGEINEDSGGFWRRFASVVGQAGTVLRVLKDTVQLGRVLWPELPELEVGDGGGNTPGSEIANHDD